MSSMRNRAMAVFVPAIRLRPGNIRVTSGVMDPGRAPDTRPHRPGWRPPGPRRPAPRRASTVAPPASWRGQHRGTASTVAPPAPAAGQHRGAALAESSPGQQLDVDRRDLRQHGFDLLATPQAGTYFIPRPPRLGAK